MKIMICASMRYAKEILETKKQLESQGHSVLIPVDTQHNVDNPELPHDLDCDYEHCIKNNILKDCFDLIPQSDAVLVLNYERDGIPGYIGTSVLMEVGIAYHLNKKLFLLNSPPHYNEVRWSHEIHIMQPVILDGDLEMIK